MSKDVEVVSISELSELGFECVTDLKIVIRSIEELKGNIFPTLESLGVDVFDYGKKLISNGKIIVVRLNQDIMGMSAFYANDYEDYNAYLSFIALDKKIRGLNVGKQLIHMTEKESLDLGMKKIRLEVYHENYNAIRFYEKGGYKLIGEKKNGFMTMEKCLVV